jgi:hypothetical protein
MVSGSISTPTIPVPGLSDWCRPSPGQGEFHRGRPPAYVLVHPPWWLSGALPPALGYYDGSVAIQDTGEGLLQAIPQLHRSERRRGSGAPFASCLPYREWAATVGARPERCPLVRCRHRPCRGQPPQPSLRLRQHQIPWLEFGQSRSHPSRLALILQDHDGFVLLDLFPTGSCPPSLSRSQPITGPRSGGCAQDPTS